MGWAAAVEQVEPSSRYPDGARGRQVAVRHCKSVSRNSVLKIRTTTTSVSKLKGLGFSSAWPHVRKILDTDSKLAPGWDRRLGSFERLLRLPERRKPGFQTRQIGFKKTF
eukprot:scaffold43230_cov37-Tisochrysis_lutea.AAC.3